MNDDQSAASVLRHSAKTTCVHCSGRLQIAHLRFTRDSDYLWKTSLTFSTSPGLWPSLTWVLLSVVEERLCDSATPLRTGAPEGSELEPDTGFSR